MEMYIIVKDSGCARHDIIFAVLALIVAILVISAIVDHLNRKCPGDSVWTGRPENPNFFSTFYLGLLRSKSQKNNEIHVQRESRGHSRSMSFEVISGRVNFTGPSNFRWSKSLHHQLAMSHFVGRASERSIFRTPDLHKNCLFSNKKLKTRKSIQVKNISLEFTFFNFCANFQRKKSK